MKVAELVTQTVEELTESHTKLMREIMSIRMQKGMKVTKETHLLKQAKRTVARIKTVLNERARLQQ